MDDMQLYKVIWDNKEVGQFINPRPDMWYLEGDWKSNETSDSVQFETSLKTMDARQVMTDLSKGLEIILRSSENEDLDAVGISLDNDRLFVRLVTRKLAGRNPKQRNSLIHRLLNLISPK